MNQLQGKIKMIKQSGAIMLVDLEVQGYPMSALLTDSPFSADWLKIGETVRIVFKETEVSLMKNFTGLISMRNQLPCFITGIDKGEIMGRVQLQFQNETFMAAITSRSIEVMEIKSGDEIVALMKANEISILRVESK